LGLLNGHAATLAGVQFPDQITVGSNPLILNSMGLREKMWLDIYVAGLYLPEKTSDPKAIIEGDVPKRLQAEFIFPRVPKEQLVETLQVNIERNPGFSHSTQQKMDLCASWMESFESGDGFAFEYIPGKGTTVIIRGEVKGIIQGKEFMEAIFTIFVGEKPASEQLKKGLLQPLDLSQP